MQLDFQRYEYKYIIPERIVRDIRAFIACYTEPDPFTRTHPKQQYVITSLYLDTPQLAFHLAKERKIDRRFKLRIRTYGERADGPIFAEIKRKIKDVIYKQRVALRPYGTHVPLLSLMDFIGSYKQRDRHVLQSFLDLCALHTVGPSMLVRYTREAYESTLDTYGRVTFDRVLEGHRPQALDFLPDTTTWTALDDPISTETRCSTILELKFAGRAPCWMVDLVQRFGLQRRGFSKYSTAVTKGLEYYRSDAWRCPIV